MKTFARILFVLSLTAFNVGDGITMVAAESPGSPVVAIMSVTVVSASPTQPAGTSVSNMSGTETFTSETDDPLGPFSNKSVLFWGTSRGMLQVYLYQIDFSQEVTLESIIVEAAAWIAVSPGVPSTIRLLDANSAEIANTIVDVALNEANDFKSVKFDLTGITGTTFFLEEVVDICCWRYRSKIEVFTVEGHTVPSTTDNIAWLIPILNILLDDDSE